MTNWLTFKSYQTETSNLHSPKLPEFLRIIVCWNCNFLNFGKSFTYNENGYRASRRSRAGLSIHCLSSCSCQSSRFCLLEFTVLHNAFDAWNCITVCWSRRNGWNTRWFGRKFLQKFKTSTSNCFLCALLLYMFSIGRSNGFQIRIEMNHSKNDQWFISYAAYYMRERLPIR